MNRHGKMNQRGIATLTTAVVVLVVITVMVLFAARVSIFDQRMSGNEIRYREAFAQAEAGLDFAMTRFGRAFRAVETDPIGNLPTIIPDPEWMRVDGTVAEDANGGAVDASFRVEIVPTGMMIGEVPIFEFISEGVGEDLTSAAVVRRQATMAHVLAGGAGPDVPVIVSGVVGTGGNFQVVANPNAGGPGVPVSIWSDENITVSGSSATCHQEFYFNGQCSNPSGNQENITTGRNPAVALEEYTASMPDLLPNDANFPDDLFGFIFGVPREDWELKRDEAASHGQLVENCGAVSAAGAAAGQNFPLWWVTGDCSFAGGAVIGSEDRPVILVVEDSELRITGGGTFFGIVYVFDNPDTPSTSPSLQFTGNVEVFGSLISDVGGAQMDGTFSVVYSPTVLESFSGETGGGINFTMVQIPGSWRDF